MMDSITTHTKSTGKKKMDNLTKWTLAAALYIVFWSITFFIAWCLKGEEPGILEGCILAPGVTELICGAVLKLGKNKKEISQIIELLETGRITDAIDVLKSRIDEEDQTNG